MVYNINREMCKFYTHDEISGFEVRHVGCLGLGMVCSLARRPGEDKTFMVFGSRVVDGELEESGDGVHYRWETMVVCDLDRPGEKSPLPLSWERDDWNDVAYREDELGNMVQYPEEHIDLITNVLDLIQAPLPAFRN